jgi:nicotinamide mononucleotide adenylyltransferase
MFDSKKPTAQMLGRWQPWHDGHTELFKRAYEQTGQVCIMIRNVQGINDNPFDMDTVRENIIKALATEGFEYRNQYNIINVPNIVDISYGRGVGYSLTQHDLGATIHNISATSIRKQMRDNGEL